MTRRTSALVALVAVAVATVVLVRASTARVRTGSGAAHGATIVRYRIRSRFVHR